MKLKEISVQGLYGQYNYRISLDGENRIKVLTGPNGYGKTTLLNLIHSLYTANFYYFFLVPFHQIDFEFCDGNESKNIRLFKRATRTGDVDDSDNIAESVLVLEDDVAGEVTISRDVVDTMFVSNGYVKFKNDQWIERTSDTYYSCEDLTEKHPDIYEKFFSENISLLMFIRGLNCVFIKDQRLFCSEYLKSPISNRLIHVEEYTIENIQKKLKTILVGIKESLFNDFQSYILNIVNTESADNEIPHDKLLESYKKLAKLGLFQSLDIEKDVVTDKGKILLKWCYQAYEGIDSKTLQKLEQFYKLLHESDFSDKNIEVNPKFGFRFTNTKEEEVPINKLSSGEQHRIILFYKLLFESSEDTLLLVDEPELSFHVAWQLRFLRDMKAVVASRAIIATHSPQIIDEQWDLTYDLFENNKAE